MTTEHQEYEDKFFTEETNIDPYGSGTLSRTTKRVSLYGKVPTPTKPEGYAAINFSMGGLKDVMIHLNHLTLTSNIFHGLKAPLSSDLRKISRYVNQKGRYGFSLGSSEIATDEDTANELVDVIDWFGEKYYKALRDTEEELGTARFLKGRSGYRLIRVHKTLWEGMLNFQSNHYYAREEKNEWNLFSSQDYLIQIYTQGHQKYHDGFHAVFRGEASTDIHESGQVWITCEPITDKFDSKQRYSPDSLGLWDAQMAYDFLVTELIPRVVFENESKERSEKAFKVFLKGYDADRFIANQFFNKYINKHSCSSHQELYDVFIKLQQFYSCQNPLYLEQDSCRSVYHGVKMVLAAARTLDTHLVAGNLGLNSLALMEQILDHLDGLMLKSTSKSFESCELDVLLRSPAASLMNPTTLTGSQFNMVAELMGPLIDHYNRSVLFEKCRPIEY